MVASGVAFGFAGGVAGAQTGRATSGALLVVGWIPVVVVVYYFGVWGTGWLPLYINTITEFLITPATVTVSSVAVGVLAVALVGGRRVSS